MVVVRGWGGRGMRSYCLKGTEFQFCKMKTSEGGWWWWLHKNVLHTAHWTVYLKMVRMVDTMFCVFYYKICFFSWVEHSLSYLGEYKRSIQPDFGIEHLLISMCRVFSCVVGRGCLLWPVPSLGKTLLDFALLHSVLQGQICLLLQVFLDFLLLHSSPL